MRMKWTSRAHPISDIRDWKRNDRLELQPDFQRNVIWTKSAQIALIDTILLNIPFPKIYIQAIVKNENTYRIVIDGQQRLTAILDFIGNRLELKRNNLSPEFAKYDGKTFHELPEQVRNDILQYNVDFNEISNSSEDQVRDMYARVNKYTVQLNKQELRRADYPGDYMDVAEELSDFPYFDAVKMFTAGQKRRMLDIEYILELLCIIQEGEQDKKNSLDEFCERYAILSGVFSSKDESDFDEKVTHFFKSKPELLEDAEEAKGFKTRFAKRSQGSKKLISAFCDILSDLLIIFDDSFPLERTRFRQKADFYSLFSAIHNLRENGKRLVTDNLNQLRNQLKELNDGIAPHSENEEYREYAIRCISDANSLSSRQWRRNFLNRFLSTTYVPQDMGEQ